MKTIKVLAILSIILTVCFNTVYCAPLNKERKEINPIDSSFGYIDSVVIDYFIPAEAAKYIITFNKKSITINSNSHGEKVIINPESVKRMINYVEALFISGSEKTEKGRSYRSKLVFSDYEKISISLFAKGELWVTHEISSGMENYSIEFSEYFQRFNIFLDHICNQVKQ